jgi:hypothetical protein
MFLKGNYWVNNDKFFMGKFGQKLQGLNLHKYPLREVVLLLASEEGCGVLHNRTHGRYEKRTQG